MAHPDNLLPNRFSVRKFGLDDFPEILSLWNLCDMGGAEREDTAQTIQKCNQLGGTFLILELSDPRSIAGTSWITWDGRRMHLHHFCIHPDYRNKGLGRYLAKKSLEFVRNKKAQVKLEVHKDNMAAKKLYTKLGFIPMEEYNLYMIRTYD